MSDPLDKTLMVSEHVSERVRTQKITPAQAMGDIMTALLEKMTLVEQMGVEKQLNETVAKLDEKTRNEVLVWRNPYEPKIFTTTVSVWFQGIEHKNHTVEFTIVGDIAHMVVHAWEYFMQIGDRNTPIFLHGLPKEYRPQFVQTVHNIDIIYNSQYCNNGVMIIYSPEDTREISIFRKPTNNVYQCGPEGFGTSGNIGFSKFMVTYSLK